MSHDQGPGREPALRRVGAALSREVTAEGIGGVACTFARDLIGPRRSAALVFVIGAGEALDVIAASPGEAASSSELAGLVRSCLPQLRSLEAPESHLVEGVLLCPLVLAGRPSGDPLIGVLAVEGEHATLSGLSPALGIVASQLALALERAALGAEVARLRHEARFRARLQDALDVILVLDDDGIITYASPSAAWLFGDTPLRGTNVDRLIAGGDQSLADLESDHAMSEDPHRGLYQMSGPGRQQLLVQVRVTDLRDDDAVQGRVLTLRDVTKEHRLQDELERQAFYDKLTGLPNRTLFTDRAERAIAAAQRTGTTAAVLFVDLDDFKVVNDTMGHAVGDELLAAVAGRLSAATRESDTACRLGGDEFALLVENQPDSQAAEAFAERVVAAFAEPFTLSAGSVVSGASVGVATTADCADGGELLRHADLSLYAAKSDGKHRWHRYTSELTAEMDKRRKMQATLEDAIAMSALTLAYQPIADLTSGTICSFEAMVRWPHHGEQLIPPEFIQVAEETGLIIPLGSWFLRQAIRDMAHWRDAHFAPPRLGVGVNVSTRQFRDPGFVTGLRRCLDETGLAPSALVLELSESLLLDHDDRIAADLSQLSKLGVRLALDHFGTGYPSLSHLCKLRLSVDILKIDKGYVEAIGEPQGRKFAEIIVNFAQAMEIRVVADGIETEEQRALLLEMGCQRGQGDLLAPPMQWPAAQELLGSGRVPMPTARPDAH